MNQNTPLSKDKAKALVRNFADDHGYLSEEVLNTMSDATREKVIDVMLKKDRLIGSSVVT
jgi:hypothetical protein